MPREQREITDDGPEHEGAKAAAATSTSRPTALNGAPEPPGGDFAADLVAAIAEIGNVPKDRTATVPTKSGGQYSYTYADLGSIMDHVRPILARHRLAIVQRPGVRPSSAGLAAGCETMILHASGDSLSSELWLPVQGSGAQAIGSAITYARRYSLAIVGVVTEEDDDGAAAQVPAKQPPAKDPKGPKGPTDAQVKRYWAKVKVASDGDREIAEEIHSQARKCAGVESLTVAGRTQYDAMCAFVDSWGGGESKSAEQPEQPPEGGWANEDIPF